MKSKMELIFSSKLKRYTPKTWALYEKYAGKREGELILGLIHNAFKAISRRKVVQIMMLQQLDEILLSQFHESINMIRKMADEMFDLLTKQKGM